MKTDAKSKDDIQAEGLDAIGERNKSGVVVTMGAGKCLLGLKHMAKHYNDLASYLVVTPKKSIYKSWTNDAKEFGFELFLEHMEFVSYRSLTKLNTSDYDIIYLDECHSLKLSHKEWLLEFEQQGGIIVGLTGTYPIYKNTEKGKMCNYFCPKVYEYVTDEAIEDGILNDYKIFIHQLYLDGAPNIPVKTKKSTSFMTSEVKNYQYWNTRIEMANNPKAQNIARIQRMRAMMDFKSKERYAEKLLSRVTKKTLIFANTQAQADRLCKHSVHSKNKSSETNLELFKEGTILKLSAVEQLSEGVTVPNLETGIIMHSYANNKKAAQKIGRFLRLSPEQTATIHILCYVNSIDKEWVTNALDSFDEEKIEWIHPIT